MSAEIAKPTFQPNPLRILAGLALTLPACICCTATLALPTLQTWLLSMQNASPLRKAENVGMANYTRLFESLQFSESITFSLLLAAERVAIVILVPLLLALAINEFRQAGRISARLLFSLPLALFAPLIAAMSWKIVLNPASGLVSQPGRWLANPTQARLGLLGIDALATFGLACGIGLIVYLIALRGTGDSVPTWQATRRPLLITWAVTLLASIALSFQWFDPSFVLTGGGPQNSTFTLAFLQYTLAFRHIQFGMGAAIATLILIILMLLGLAAGLLVILSRLHVETVSPGKPVGLMGQSRRPLALILLLVVGLGSALCVLLGLFPALWTGWVAICNSAGFEKVNQAISIVRVMINTTLPVVMSVLFTQLPIAYLAALGIGASRPLGRYSGWLLLPFSPWLFVTTSPLSIVAYQRLAEAKLFGTLPAAISPIMISIPMLFTLALFFSGQEPKWRAAQAAGQSAMGAFMRTMILPSLPLAALLACFAIAIGYQESVWPLVAAIKPESAALPNALTQIAGAFSSDSAILAAALTILGLPAFLLNVLVLGVFQIFYLDRLAVGKAN